MLDSVYKSLLMSFVRLNYAPQIIKYKGGNEKH